MEAPRDGPRGLDPTHPPHPSATPQEAIAALTTGIPPSTLSCARPSKRASCSDPHRHLSASAVNGWPRASLPLSSARRHLSATLVAQSERDGAKRSSAHDFRQGVRSAGCVTRARASRSTPRALAPGHGLRGHKNGVKKNRRPAAPRRNRTPRRSFYEYYLQSTEVQ